MSEENTATREVFRVGIGRRIALMAVFGMMLPFFISMPIMTALRAVHGNIIDASVIAVAMIIFAICLYYLALQIQAAQKIKIEIDNDSVHIVTPNWRGMFPTSPYTDRKVAFSEIQSVEERGELYKIMGVIGIPRVSSVVTKDGQRLVLGAVTEDEADPAIQYGEVAKIIAQRANLGISDRGVINAGTQIGVLMKGSPSWDKEPISEGQIQAIRKRTFNIRRGLVYGFLLLAALGSFLLMLPAVRNLIGIEG